MVLSIPRTVLVPLARLTKLEPTRIADIKAFADQVPIKMLSTADMETITYTDFDA